MTGYEIRLKRFLPDGERIVVLAADHGLFLGPVPGLEDFPGTIKKLARADAVLMAPGMARFCTEVFSRQQRPNLILRLNWASGHLFNWGYTQEEPSEMIYPEDALAMGADVALVSLTLDTGNEAIDARNVKVFAEMVRRKEKCGLPLIAEYYPVRPDRNEEQIAEDVYNISRMACEMGADALKTFYIGKLSEQLNRNVPIPILALGGDKKSEVGALQQAQASIKAGMAGVVFGRNIFQAKKPEQFLEALISVVKHNKDPENAAKEFNLT